MSIETKRSDDLVKLVNFGQKAMHFTYNSLTRNVNPGESVIVSREIAEHGVAKTHILVKDELDGAVLKPTFKIEELPEGQRTQEALGKSAEDVKKLTGNLVDLRDKLVETEQLKNDLLEENAKLRAKIEKLKK